MVLFSWFHLLLILLTHSFCTSSCWCCHLSPRAGIYSAICFILSYTQIALAGMCSMFSCLFLFFLVNKESLERHSTACIPGVPMWIVVTWLWSDVDVLVSSECCVHVGGCSIAFPPDISLSPKKTWIV